MFSTFAQSASNLRPSPNTEPTTSRRMGTTATDPGEGRKNLQPFFMKSLTELARWVPFALIPNATQSAVRMALLPPGKHPTHPLLSTHKTVHGNSYIICHGEKRS